MACLFHMMSSHFLLYSLCNTLLTVEFFLNPWPGPVTNWIIGCFNEFRHKPNRQPPTKLPLLCCMAWTICHSSPACSNTCKLDWLMATTADDQRKEAETKPYFSPNKTGCRIRKWKYFKFSFATDVNKTEIPGKTLLKCRTKGQTGSLKTMQIK